MLYRITKQLQLHGKANGINKSHIESLLNLPIRFRWSRLRQTSSYTVETQNFCIYVITVQQSYITRRM
jgi:hypothetical protein